jgi:putative hemolysin
MSTVGLWAILVGLLLFRALLSALEAALQQLSEGQVKALALTGRRGQRLQRLKADPEASAAALRMGMVLAGFTATAIGVTVPPRLLDTTMATLVAESSWLMWLTPLAAALLVATVTTLTDLTFRSAGQQKPEVFGLSLSALGVASVAILYPLVRLLVAPLNVALRLFDTQVTFQPPPPPLETLEKLLTEQAKKDEVDKGAPALIRGVFELSDKTVRDVMVPRTEVIALELSTPIVDILQVVAEEGHSRLPVYRDDIDRVVGVLHVRDIVPMLQTPGLIVLSDVIRPAVYVPWVKPIGDLLRDMQKKRIHMAVVVDEFGGFSGIVTLEDILREIVGDIGDEFDEEQRTIERLADGSVVVDASLSRSEFESAFNMTLPEGDFETLAGFLSQQAGAIPDVGDRFSVDGWTYAVVAKDGPRLARVQVVRPKGHQLEKRNSREFEVVLPPPSAPRPR